MRALTIALGALVWATAALADPTGTFRVEGTNPNSDGTYEGTVTVERTGKTYRIVWEIAGQSFIGTGLGALFRGDEFVIGEADRNDTALSVGYISGPSAFGMAMYFQKKDGRWEGVWTYGGSEDLATETWYPVE